MNTLLTAEKSKSSGPKPIAEKNGSAQISAATPGSNMRSASCTCGGSCPRCNGRSHNSHRLLQTKLKVRAAGDIYEQEADRVADQILTTPMHETIGNRTAVNIQRLASNSAQKSSAPPVSVDHVISGSGRPLESSLQQDMGQRFGEDFSHVRIHTDTAAQKSAKDINAHAYTVGHNIVFGASQYAPNSQQGRRLLAHELTHVVQQSDGLSPGVIQRAEVDDRSCAGLTDIETDINTQVNSDLAAARTAAGAAPIPAANIPAFLRDVATRLGGFTPVSPIETFIESLPATKRRIPPNSLAGTKYSGVGSVNNFYHLQTLGVAHVVGSSAKVHGICVGADKLGHFFEEGFIYHTLAGTPGLTSATAESVGRGFEISIQGLAATGVYSNADLAANRAGLQFYTDLAANPSGLTFDVGTYISTQWNEQSNPSFYGASEAGVIWQNLLTGGWQGPFTAAGGTSTPINSKVNLTASATAVTGSYKWPAGAASPNTGTITNGVITQRTTAVSGLDTTGSPTSATPVSGVTISFDWSEGSSSGKGIWSSTNEQTLTGTWGIGTSAVNGGSWQLTKI